MLTHKHLIAGEWIGSDTTFNNEPVNGEVDSFAVGTSKLIDQAVQAAEEAFESYGYTSRVERAEFLRTIAREIETRGEAITVQGVKETGLPEMRLNGERGRTIGQLQLFADHIEVGDYLDRRHNKALPERTPLPRPDLKLIQRPMGPVAIFGASNFPLAFSTAGGDTASALAAGCPVVVKGHSAHPGISDIVAQAIDAAIKICGVHPGVFSQIQGDNHAIGQALVQHPLIKAVGFTGSLGGGRALFDLCAARPEPIPFFGELGSVNPMFLLPSALDSRAKNIAAGWAASLTMGAGQFCTNPGIAVMLESEAEDIFTTATVEALENVGTQTMLTGDIAKSYHKGCERITATKNVREVLVTSCSQRNATPFLFSVFAADWMNETALSQEVFGPLGMIVTARDMDEMCAIAKSLQGQLTCTIHMDDADTKAAKSLIPILERKAGRLLANGFPTGVEVCDAMIHGGPYPASTNFGATSVGTMAIRRWLRPVSYQNMPSELIHDA